MERMFYRDVVTGCRIGRGNPRPRALLVVVVGVVRSKQLLARSQQREHAKFGSLKKK